MLSMGDFNQNGYFFGKIRSIRKIHILTKKGQINQSIGKVPAQSISVDSSASICDHPKIKGLPHSCVSWCLPLEDSLVNNLSNQAWFWEPRVITIIIIYINYNSQGQNNQLKALLSLNYSPAFRWK